MKADRNTLVMKRPASWNGDMWRTGLPAGNGLTGALMYGAIADETIVINRHDLWQGGGKSGQLPDISDSLADMRAMLDRGKYAEANGIMCRALTDSGYSEGLPTPLPLCALKINRDCGEMFRDYARGVKMDRAEIFTRWVSGGAKYERRLFVSRPDDIVYIKIKGGGCEKYTLAPQEFGKSCPAAVSGEISANKILRVDADSRCVYYASSVDGTEYGAVMRVVGPDISVKQEDDFLSVTGEDYVIMLKTFCGQIYDSAFKALFEQLCAVPCREDIYRERLAANLMKYSMIYNSVSIELASKEEHRASNEELLDAAYESEASPALLEKLWRFGRYLFISGTSEEGNPFPLYGLWHGDYNLMWAQNVANENVQMIYRHADAGGLSYAIKALIKYYGDMLPIFEENAKKLFGCAGIYVPAYTAPNCGGPSVNVPVILNWISCAGWLSAHFYSYYRYTGDRELLLSDILPFMFKTALFYEKYLTYDGDGKCVIYPSISPENTPGNLLPDNFKENMGHPCPSVKNAVMDFAIMREHLNNLIEATESVNIALYTKKINTWKGIIASIPEYKINSDGAVKEWTDDALDDNYYHRHLSHLYPVFPGNEITPDSDKKLLDAFGRAVKLRQVRGQTGWSFAHMSCIYARLGMGGDALNCLDLLCKGCLLDNFFTLHNDWRHMGVSLDIDVAPVQLDALMGMVEAIQELSARYANGTLYILPAPSARLRDIKVRDLRFPGGMVSFEYGRDDTLSISVYAVKDIPLCIVTPNKKFEANLESGKSYRFKG